MSGVAWPEWVSQSMTCGDLWFGVHRREWQAE